MNYLVSSYLSIYNKLFDISFSMFNITIFPSIVPAAIIGRIPPHDDNADIGDEHNELD